MVAIALSRGILAIARTTAIAFPMRASCARRPMHSAAFWCAAVFSRNAVNQILRFVAQHDEALQPVEGLDGLGAQTEKLEQIVAITAGDARFQDGLALGFEGFVEARLLSGAPLDSDLVDEDCRQRIAALLAGQPCSAIGARDRAILPAPARDDRATLVEGAQGTPDLAIEIAHLTAAQHSAQLSQPRLGRAGLVIHQRFEVRQYGGLLVVERPDTCMRGEFFSIVEGEIHAVLRLLSRARNGICRHPDGGGTQNQRDDARATEKTRDHAWNMAHPRHFGKMQIVTSRSVDHALIPAGRSGVSPR